MFDGESSDAAKNRIIGQISSDHGIDFGSRPPAKARAEHILRVQALHERLQELVLKDAWVGFDGNCPSAARNLSGDSAGDLGPSLPHRILADGHAYVRELVVVG